MTGLTSITAIALIALRFTLVSALPNVTVISLPGEKCQSWPAWVNIPNDVSHTDKIEFMVDQADDPALNGLYADSWRSTNSTGGATQSLYISLMKTRYIAKPSFTCSNGSVFLTHRTVEEPLLVHTSSWPYSLQFGEGVKLQVYEHEINGVRQPGKFLGANGQTTWVFRMKTEEGCTEKTWTYEPRLLSNVGEDTKTSTPWEFRGDFRGFLKVVPWNTLG